MTKRLYKSNTNKVIAGVIGGIGEYFNIDPTILRIIYVLIAILSHGFPAIIVYIIAWAVMPKHPDIHHIHHVEHTEKN